MPLAKTTKDMSHFSHRCMHMGTRHGPGRFCMQHLDFLVRMSQNLGLGRTLDTSKIIQMHGFL